MIDFTDPLATLAYSLGIPIYVGEDGRLTQHGPGRRIDPDPKALPVKHGAPLQVESDPAAT